MKTPCFTDSPDGNPVQGRCHGHNEDGVRAHDGHLTAAMSPWEALIKKKTPGPLQCPRDAKHTERAQAMSRLRSIPSDQSLLSAHAKCEASHHVLPKTPPPLATGLQSESLAHADLARLPEAMAGGHLRDSEDENAPPHCGELSCEEAGETRLHLNRSNLLSGRAATP